MARSVGRPDRTYFHVTGRPDSLGLILRIERDHVCQIRWAARETRFVLGAALGDLAGLDKCVRSMRDIFSATVGEPENRCCIRTADYVDLWSLQVPTQHHDVGKTFRVISVYLRKEDCVQLWRRYFDLWQGHVFAPAGIEPQLDGAAAVAVVGAAHQR